MTWGNITSFYDMYLSLIHGSSLAWQLFAAISHCVSAGNFSIGLVPN